MAVFQKLLPIFISISLVSTAVACGRENVPVPVSIRRAGEPGTVKITTRRPGMVRLTLADLASAGAAGLGAGFDRARLTHRGQEQAVWLTGGPAEEALIFYAAPADSPATQENVYLLDWGPGQGKRMVELPLRKGDGASSKVAKEKRHFEENERYSPLVDTGDHWMWLMLSAPGEEQLKLFLDHVASSPGLFRLEVWASTEALVSPDHHLIISVNGTQVLDEAWDGKGRRRLEANLPEGLLIEGENTVLVQARGDSGAPADIVYIDWLETEYTREMAAREDSLEFESQGQPQELSGFQGPVSIFDITDTGEPRLAGKGLPVEGGKVRFTGETGRHYLAVGREGYTRPGKIQAASLVPDFRRPAEGAHYLAIGPADLLEPLQPLFEQRRGQGLKVKEAPLEAVYDQFGYGLPEAEAIHRFLQHAARTWQPAPHYVLLVGDATYDPRGYRAVPAANRLPTMHITTESGGETASDVRLALLDEDGWPDLALGRLPARNPGQVRAYVDKILAYEQVGKDSSWRARILAIADGQEASFTHAAQQLLDLFPEGYRKTLYHPLPGVQGAAQQISEYLDLGALFVFYFGHGSLNLWGKDRLFRGEDAARLHNAPRLPIVVTLTCLTGLFTHPEQESISESLLWQPGGGAIALLAPTSLTLAMDQSFLSTALVEAYLKAPEARWGDIVLAAQRRIPLDNPGTREVLMTYLLFGDPALTLAGKD